METSAEYAVKVIQSDNDQVSTWSSYSMWRREVDFLKSLGTLSIVVYVLHFSRPPSHCKIYRQLPREDILVHNNGEVYRG